MPRPLDARPMSFLFPFGCRDPVTQKWVRARYVAERHEISARCAAEDSYARWRDSARGNSCRRLAAYGQLQTVRVAAQFARKRSSLRSYVGVSDSRIRRASVRRLFLSARLRNLTTLPPREIDIEVLPVRREVVRIEAQEPGLHKVVVDLHDVRNQWHVDLRQLGHAPRESGLLAKIRLAHHLLVEPIVFDHAESRRIHHRRLRTLELRQIAIPERRP